MSQSSQSAPHPAAAESAPSPPRTIADSTVARPAAAAAEPYQLIAPDGSFDEGGEAGRGSEVMAVYLCI